MKYQKIARNSFKLRLDYVAVLFMVYSVGLYGYPSMSTEHNSLSGLIFISFRIIIIYSIIIFWFIQAFKYTLNTRNRQEPISIKIYLKDVIFAVLIFCFIAIVKQKELTSSITGDEINLYDNSLKIGNFLMQKLTVTNIQLQNLPARYLIGLLQLAVICILLLLANVSKLDSKWKFSVLAIAIIVLNLLHNCYLSGSSLYPDIETLPYFIASPILLIFNISPKYISVAMFSVFLLIIYRLTEYRIKQKLLRLQLIILIALLHVFTDIATTLNHGIYYTYIFTIFLIIFDKNKITSKNLIAGLLLFSIFRPTLLSILIFITVYLLKSNKDFGVLKIKLQKHMSDFYIFIPQYLILGILVISGAVYAHYDDKSRSSLSQNLSLWIKNIINIDHQAFTIIIIGLIFIIVQRKYYYLFLFISSFIVYCITAPRGNLSNPIYKAEILSPFLIIILVIIFSFISKLSIEFENYEKKKLAITQRYILILINLFVIYNFISSYNQIQFSNFSWDPKYESFSNERKISDKVYHFSQYASFGKVYYNKQALDIVTRQNCKFLDITYSGSMFLNTNISARNFINLARPLTIDATELNFSNEVKCVVVGNYPGKKFAEENEKLRLNFTLIESFYQNDLKTYLKIYAR